MSDKKPKLRSLDDPERKLFDQAVAMKIAGDLDGAIAIFRQLDEKKPNCALYKAQLGNASWSKQDIEAALRYFREAIRLAPSWEPASLGLFHVLWENDRKDEAFEEIKRFQTVSYSKDYAAIIEEINST